MSPICATLSKADAVIPLYFHPLWAQIFWFSYVTWALFEMWVWSRDRRKAEGEKQDRGSLLFISCCMGLGFSMLFSAPWLAPFARMQLPAAPIFYLAIILIWSGLLFRFWAIRTLGKFFRYTVFIHDEHRLVTAGPYRILRHPSYTGALMTITGIALAMYNWVSFGAAIAFALLAYGRRMQVEEAALEIKFGDAFRQNRARTWALIPCVW